MKNKKDTNKPNISELFLQRLVDFIFCDPKFPNLWKLVFFCIYEYSKHLVISEMPLFVAQFPEKHLQINGKPHSQGHPFCIYIGGSGFDVALTKGGWGCISTPFGMEFEAFLNFTACVISQVVANMYDMLILMTAM